MVIRLTISLTLLLLVSCGSSVGFVSILDMPKDIWRSDEWVEFNFNQQDSVSTNKINLIVRHKPDFKYDGLLLEVRTTNSENHCWCDTVKIPLTDGSNEWKGKNLRTHYDLNVLYRKGVRFTRTGKYNIKIKYLYPADSLEGIKAIGMTIEQDGKE